MVPKADHRQSAPAASRNRQPILTVLQRVLPQSGLVLELASGTGEHAVYFAEHLPHVVWQPSDPDADARASISAWIEATGAANVHQPLSIDATAYPWPIEKADAVVCINMIHIAPWAAAAGLFRGAADVLRPGGVLYLYGPYKRDGRHTAPSNAEFDRSLRARDPRWGVRDLDEVAAAAAAHGLRLSETIEMPANNLSVVLRR